MPLALLPHQHVAADFLASRERAGLFDDMGSGKSASAIAALDKLRLRRGVIVCPAAVREVWTGEFRKFATIPRKLIKARSITDLNLWLRGRVDVLIVSYEMAVRWKQHLEGDILDFLIFDEAHYLKSHAALRTRAMLSTHCDGVYGAARWACHVWFLTGTPAPNDPCDIWPWLRFVGGTTLSLRHFTDRYFRTRLGAYSARHTPRNEMVAELRQAIELHSLRRTKDEIGLKLPPVFLTTTTVDGDTAEISALLRAWPDLEAGILAALDKGGLSFLDAQHIMTLRRLVAEAKAPAFVELLLEELRDGLDKVVVFGIHRRALDSIAAGLQRGGETFVRFDGETSERDRQGAVEAFQRNDGPRVFLGNIRAAGTGLTLTAAADVILFESDWSPAANAQALMRVHRIGQTRAVRARFISLANSLDVMVSEIVAEKTAAIAKIGLTMAA